MRQTSLSFEFFPPKTEAGLEKLLHSHKALQITQPDFFSITYGAGGSTRERTRDIALQFNKISPNITPHISLSGDDLTEVKQLLDDYKNNNIHRLVALLGDNANHNPKSTAITMHAIDMVRLIRQHSDDYFHISVAAYPETHYLAKDAKSDLQFLKEKLDAGGNQTITQFFYGETVWSDFYERYSQLGIKQPIIAGVMPLSPQSLGFCEKCQVHVPTAMKAKVTQYADDQQSLHQYNLDYLTEFCQNLLNNGADGIHFYSLNQCNLFIDICRKLY